MRGAFLALLLASTCGAEDIPTNCRINRIAIQVRDLGEAAGSLGTLGLRAYYYTVGNVPIQMANCWKYAAFPWWGFNNPHTVGAATMHAAIHELWPGDVATFSMGVSQDGRDFYVEQTITYDPDPWPLAWRLVE